MIRMIAVAMAMTIVLGQTVKSLGDLTGSSIVGRTTNELGQTVVQARDTAGGLVEYVFDTAGKLLNSRPLGR